MSILNDLSKDMVIFISGTPCTGKTTVASELNDYLSNNGVNSKFIKINDFALENNLVLGEDPDKFYKVVDIDKLNDCLNKEIKTFLGNRNQNDDIIIKQNDDININQSNDINIDINQNNMNINQNKISILIVEGHLSHLCEGADKMIVLRLNPSILRGRLEERNYTESKIQENLEAEALAVCSAEAYDIYGEKTNEIDVSDKSIEEIRDLILYIVSDNSDCPIGSIDFMEWFLN
ncbi:adenylate kinase family protein [Methanobrevibacter olleyae]|uniref:Putative adenylate kinase n=1 Tax=Methanobrevibacter olleyae TaxID=294671 RepID=A0A126QZ26_METOL|nr:adenylate kinase family protein [Methanobrevibacter olleyae]AMK14625.1 hypothetical protein YLM1_0065 [Methanobrevibacter olleyae]SFL26737.1 adenylate kinase [Methanobrevibacter olleyae]